MMATASVIDLQEDLFDRAFKFRLTARLTQDCVKNIFSLVRLKNPIPSKLAFKNAPKIIAVFQFVKVPNRPGSYEEDESDFARGDNRFVCNTTLFCSCIYRNSASMIGK